MAVKKSSKSVLDYDPLAWMNEESEEAEIDNLKTAEMESEKSIVKDSVTPKKATKKAATKKTESKKATTKKKKSEMISVEKGSDNSEVAEEKTEATTMNDATETDPGFGFFSDDDLESNADISQAAPCDLPENTINLGAELTIRQVSTCKETIDEVLNSGYEVNIAAGELQKIDTAGLQLLLSLQNTLEKTSQSINWTSSNSIINEASDILGLPKLMEPIEDESFGFFE